MAVALQRFDKRITLLYPGGWRLAPSPFFHSQTFTMNHPQPPFPRPSQAPPAFHLLVKPTGAACNLDCAYCFFLDKEALYPHSKFRMTDEMLEEYIRQLIEAHQTDHVTIAWQGGEPTLMGLDFYRRSVELVEKYRRPGMEIMHSMQTNGVLLNDAWCEFFKENNFLIGISLDGPRYLHDIYRRDKGGGPTFDRVMRGVRCLQKHGVEFNVLVTVNRANADFPLEVYRFLRDEAGADWLQFIPISWSASTPTAAPSTNRGPRSQIARCSPSSSGVFSAPSSTNGSSTT